MDRYKVTRLAPKVGSHDQSTLQRAHQFRAPAACTCQSHGSLPVAITLYYSPEYLLLITILYLDNITNMTV